MRVTIERLRLAILVVAGFLLVGVLSFFGYARWQVRRIGRDLPAKLGIEIQQSSNGFTFSKSQGGRTLFTLHAAKAVQFKSGGHATLHDVSITVYDAKGGVTDRISGDEFDYDPVASIVHADGAVQIDLVAPGDSDPPAAGAASHANTTTVHVQTSGLIFNEKTGTASTTEKFSFSLPQAQGSAVGASFDSGAGVLILQSDVAFDSSLDGGPISVHARHAQYDRASHLLYLLNQETEYAQNRGSSDQATVYFRPDGSAYQMKAQGHVTVVGSEGQRITSQSAHVSLNPKSQPEEAVFDGGLLYVSDDAQRQVHGAAVTGTLLFGPEATLRKAHLENAVSIVDNEKPQPQSSRAGSTAGEPYLSLIREARGGQIDIDFSADAARRPVAQHILATSAASVNIRTLYAAKPPQETSVAADRLFANIQGGVALSSLQGSGHTKLIMGGSGTNDQTSTGDNLLLTFAAPPPKTGKQAQTKRPAAMPASQEQPDVTAQLQSLEQTGHVTVVQTSSAPPPAPSRTMTATAERATYDAATQLVWLYGSPEAGDPRIQESDGDLTAGTIEIERATGDLTATGQVKATYRQSPAQPGISLGGAEPVHIVASRAHVDRATDLATFYGGQNADARLWQGADSISAPVLELSHTRQTLSAHDVAGGSAAQPVTAVFTDVDATPAPKPGNTPSRNEGSLVRVRSRKLFYTGAESKAVFDGGVVTQTSTGVVRSSVMDVYLTGSGQPGSTQPGSGQKQPSRQSQQVERIVAREGVQLEQPDRKGTGSQLVYTAQDGRFVLTGSSSQPPRITDRVHGTVTGSSLIFNDSDDSVIVSGGSSKAVTETRTSK
jgi:lipopolysaccharide export system protein LptA